MAWSVWWSRSAEADKNIRILLISPDTAWGKVVWEQGYDPEFNEKSVEVSKGLKAVYQKVAEKIWL